MVGLSCLRGDGESNLYGAVGRDRHDLPCHHEHGTAAGHDQFERGSDTSSSSAITESPATTGTAALTTTRYEEDNPKLVRDGSWTFTGGADDSGGSCRYTEDAGSSVTIQFMGISFSFITRTGLALGKVKITLDSGSPIIVDCYSAAPGYQQIVWAADPLETGTHYVKIECDGTMNPASGGTGIYVDAFAVTGTLE